MNFLVVEKEKAKAICAAALISYIYFKVPTWKADGEKAEATDSKQAEAATTLAIILNGVTNQI